MFTFGENKVYFGGNTVYSRGFSKILGFSELLEVLGLCGSGGPLCMDFRQEVTISSKTMCSARWHLRIIYVVSRLCNSFKMNLKHKAQFVQSTEYVIIT